MQVLRCGLVTLVTIREVGEKEKAGGGGGFEGGKKGWCDYWVSSLLFLSFLYLPC